MRFTSRITKAIKQDLIANMRIKDYTEMYNSKDSASISDYSYLTQMIKDCDYNCACFEGKDLLFCSGIIKNASEDHFGTFWLLSTKNVEKHRIAYVKALRMLCKKYLTLAPKGIFTYIASDYTEAIKVAESFGFQHVYTTNVDNYEEFIYILLGR